MEMGPFSLGFGTYCALAKNERLRAQRSEGKDDNSILNALRDIDDRDEEDS